MASVDTPGQLLDACKAYHRNVALAHLDRPPGAARESRLAEARVQAQSACSISALKETARLGAGAGQQRLNAWGLGMHVGQRLQPAWRAAQSRLHGATCYIEERALPLLQGFGRMAAERRRDQRELIESAVVARLGNVNEAFEACFEEQRRVAADLEFHSADGLWSGIAGIDSAKQEDAATEVLEQTREMYVDLMTWAVKRRLRLTLNELRRHDVLAMFTLEAYEHYYQPGAVVPAMQACCRHMGLDPEADGRLIWRERPGHFGSPEAVALQVPDEVVLAYPPIYGAKGTELWASALGRALSWVHADADLPLVHRLLPDPTIAEGNARLIADLAAHPDWLRHYQAVWVDDDYCLWRHLDRLYRLRRQLGRFLFTRHLYTADSLAGVSETYRDIMMEACCVDYAPEYYLLDVDWQYESLAALWGQGLACLLLDNLRRQFSDDWFRNPESGAWLRQHWAAALGRPVKDLMHELSDSEWTSSSFAEMLAGVRW